MRSLIGETTDREFESANGGTDVETYNATVLCGAILSTGLAAQAGLERLNQTDRPPLAAAAGLDSAGSRRLGRARTSRSIPTSSIGRQTTEYLNRIYESRKQPGLRLRLWVNFSLHGDEPAPHAGNLPSFRRLDQDRVADSRARRARDCGPIDRGHATGLWAR